MVCIDDEIPFEIPLTWAWVRLNFVSIIARGSSPRPIKEYLTDSLDGINWIKIGDTEKDGMYINSTKEKITVEGLSKSRLVHKGDFLLTNSMSFGRPYITNVDGCIHDGWLVISPIGTSFKQKFLYYLLSSGYAFSQFAGKVSGAVVKNLNSDKVAEAMFPLPPYNEQQRILDKLDVLVPKINTYGIMSDAIYDMNTSLRSKLHKSILQEAIQGKLIPQDPNDEPASVLLQRIKEEKQRLVKEGKLKKKDVVDSIIYKGDDNKYYEQVDGTAIQIESDYDFPNTWAVVKLSHICRLIDGEKKEGQHICLDAKYLRGKSTGTYLDKGKFVAKGNNIILVDGENSGEVFTVPHDGYMGSTFKQLWISEAMHQPYVLYFIQFYKELLRNSKKGAAIPHLNKEIFYSLLIGIPPYQEQIRIARKIDIIVNEIKG
ncbi:restriction endonuclease subunit S [Prevotella veroralis]|uniref:Type I restriction modification DNA specificity domain protein n=1 Tax=Prevotella veroralis F0319 TaxID=649761 RepID=C9MRT9_9BACT|nr:restriction endonuclease subunit S [Prevotella veroralis]EEX17797.1 type I restriction modification DNA specificity domain protein [Prevotella veroralis F0319]